MHLLPHVAASFAITPTWLVSNGDHMVGPVETELLVRGVLSGRIPRHCVVCPATGGGWRSLDQVREVRTAYFGVEQPTSTPREAMRWVLEAGDWNEALLLALHGACAVTQASIGALYRVRPPLGLPVVSACYGEPLIELGEVVPRRDPAFRLAQEGEPTVLAPESSDAARALALRLCPEKQAAGFALIPLRMPLELTCVIELARFDHPFRSSDARSLLPLVAATAARLEELAWEA